MTKEDKELLLKDLCARLPYGVIINYNGLARPLFDIKSTQHFQITLDNAKHNGLVYISLDVDGEKPKPYLRPMSSMTENEKQVLKLCNAFVEPRSIELKVDFYNQYHFDYRGLIEKGLALEAPEGMYKEEQQ